MQVIPLVHLRSGLPNKYFYIKSTWTLYRRRHFEAPCAFNKNNYRYSEEKSVRKGRNLTNTSQLSDCINVTLLCHNVMLDSQQNKKQKKKSVFVWRVMKWSLRQKAAAFNIFFLFSILIWKSFFANHLSFTLTAERGGCKKC